jgi:Tol biopolymer transport system component
VVTRGTIVWLVFLSALSAAAPAHASFPGQNGKIAFESWFAGNPDIYTADAQGSGIRRLTSDPGYDRVPSWSPDGSRIAFFSTRGRAPGIYVMNADGSGVRLVTQSVETPFAPTWSPDGKRLAFESGDEIRAVNLDGSDEMNLTNNPARDHEPAWSPDGTKIAFWSQRDNFDAEIYVMNPDGSDQTNVTRSRGPVDVSPEWSPDGQRILFVRDGVLTTISPDGTGVTSIGPGIVPGFAPDGTKIVYAQNTGGNADIAIVNSDGSDPHVIIDNSTFDYNPDWQPIPGPQRGDFKNGAQFCKAERDFLGATAFAKKYGTNGNGANAYGKCVSQNP